VRKKKKKKKERKKAEGEYIKLAEVRLLLASHDLERS